ncbi:MAG: V-type ATP synthase subunit F [Candidatus Hodarchaeales archaeon]
MSKDILIVTYPELTLGYRLAGVLTLSARNPDSAASLIYEVIEHNSNLGLVGVDETFYKALDPEFLKKIRDRSEVIIVPIPSIYQPAKAVEIQKYVQGLIEHMTGFYLKIELESEVK